MNKTIPTFEEIVSFLNYPDEFWKFVLPRLNRVDSRVPGNEVFYATLLKFDSNNRIKDIHVMVPIIIDMKTACINIHELKHAYDMFIKLNEYVDDKDPKYEEDARNLESEFTKQYLKTKK